MSDAKDKLSVFEDNTSLRAENMRLREWNAEIALNARELVAENERLRAALVILQAAMTKKKPIPMAFKKAIIDARAALDGQPAPGKEEA